MSTVILPPTNLVVGGGPTWASPIAFNTTLPIKITQTNNLTNTPISSAAWVQLMGSADGGNTWVPFSQRTFTLDDQTNVQEFSAWLIRYYSRTVYDEPTNWYNGHQLITANWPLPGKVFQAPWTHLSLLFMPPLGGTPGLYTTVTATQG